MSTQCFNDDQPTAVVLVRPDVDPPQISTGGLCTSCATCTSPGCTELGTILDSEYEEPWCAKHAAQFSGDETVRGPDLVPINSDRYRELIS